MAQSNNALFYRDAKAIDIEEPLRTSKDFSYIVSKYEELIKFEQEAGDGAVIGAWGQGGPFGQPKGYRLHTRRDYEHIIASQGRTGLRLSAIVFDGAWFEKKIKLLEELAVSVTD